MPPLIAKIALTYVIFYAFQPDYHPPTAVLLLFHIKDYKIGDSYFGLHYFIIWKKL